MPPCLTWLALRLRCCMCLLCHSIVSQLQQGRNCACQSVTKFASCSCLVVCCQASYFHPHKSVPTAGCSCCMCCHVIYLGIQNSPSCRCYGRAVRSTSTLPCTGCLVVSAELSGAVLRPSHLAVFAHNTHNRQWPCCRHFACCQLCRSLKQAERLLQSVLGCGHGCTAVDAMHVYIHTVS